MAYTTIDDPSKYFQIALYTGNAGTNNIVNDGNSDLQPDWVWIKNRSTGGKDHGLFDSTRGTTKQLNSNNNNAENTVSTSLTAFNSDGFTLGADGGPNANSDSHVAWQWKANGGTTSTNSSGSSNSTVQANTTAGFSIVKRTGTGSAGATYGHGLGAVPDVIINKGLNSNEWYSYFKAIGGGTHWIDLSGTGAKVDDANMWNDTDATSTLFTVGNSGGSNGSSVEYIAYCFTSIQGYSKFGSYTGNANDDGPFIYTGFKPKFAIFKASSASGEGWAIRDSARSPFNQISHKLSANVNAAEGTTADDNDCDFLSNGIKLRSNDNQMNKTGTTFIYIAFAEHPFVSSEGVPVTAR